MNLVRSTICRISRPWVRMTAVGREDRGRVVGRHSGRCLRCQAEVAIERRIRRVLATMDDNLVMAPAGLLPAVMSSLDAPLPRSDEAVSKGVERAAVAAAVVGVASVLAWTLSRRVRGGA